MLRICAEHLTEDAEHQSVAVLGIALVVLGEDVGTEVRAVMSCCLCALCTFCVHRNLFASMPFKNSTSISHQTS